MKTLFKTLLDLVYPTEPVPSELPRLEPPFCERCADPYVGEIRDTFVCSNCGDAELAFRKARAAYLSKDYVRDVIHEFKYKQKFYRLPLLSKWLLEGFERFYADEAPFDALVPVPLYPSRKRERHFNQAEELAKKLSKKIRIPVMNCLIRTKNTLTQSKLRRDQRFKNQMGAYALNTKCNVKGFKLLIIDDVFTTGATTHACAHALYKKKAADVCVLTVARG
ncbi:MAG: ComF family protein [Verrucomicrobiota bacterium]